MPSLGEVDAAIDGHKHERVDVFSVLHAAFEALYRFQKEAVEAVER
jgi:hypothetical protein